jgi:outer membrane protein TolC
VTAAKSQLESEKLKPNLEVFGQYVLNGRREFGQPNLAVPAVSRDDARADTASDSLGNESPTRVIGIRISAPLGGDLKSRKEQELALQRDAARLTAEQKSYEAQRDWLDLTKRLADTRDRLELARNLEAVQKKKLDHEQIKQKSGRSTTYQVLMFEQDYVTSQLNTIRIKAESFELISRMKTFGLK